MSVAARPEDDTAVTSAPASARGMIGTGSDIATKTPASNGDEERDPSLFGIFDLLRLALDRLGAIIGGGVLWQQRLGAARLLGSILFLAGGKPFLGQSQGGHAELIVAAISRRQQMPSSGLFVLGAQCVVQICNGALVHLRIVRLDVDLRQRNSQQRRPRG